MDANYLSLTKRKVFIFTIQINVQLNLVAAESSVEYEFIPDFEADITTNGNILLETFVNRLKEKGYYLEGASFSYYSPQYEVYICCGNDPVPPGTLMPPENCESLPQNLIIRIKLKDFEEDTNIIQSDKTDLKEKKRPKERKISFVISKVLEWRKLYAGMIDDKGQIIRYSLEEAAGKVGISKKSLDDYMLQ